MHDYPASDKRAERGRCIGTIDRRAGNAIIAAVIAAEFQSNQGCAKYKSRPRYHFE